MRDVEAIKIKCKELDEKIVQQYKNILALEKHLMERRKVLEEQKKKLAKIKLRVGLYPTYKRDAWRYI